MKTLTIIMCLFASNCVYAIDFIDKYKAVSAYRDGDYARAQSLFENLYIDGFDDPEITYNLAKSEYKLDQFQKAEALYDQVLANDKISKQLRTQTHFDLGNALVCQDKLEHALQQYESVVELDPDHQQARDTIEQIKSILEQRKQQPDQQEDQKQPEQPPEGSQDSQNPQDSDTDNDDLQDEQQQDQDQQSGNDQQDDQDGNNEQQNQSGDQSQDQSNDSSNESDNESNNESSDDESSPDHSDQSGDHQSGDGDFEDQVGPDEGSQRGDEGHDNKPDDQSPGERPDGVDRSFDNKDQHDDSQNVQPDHEQQPSSEKTEQPNSEGANDQDMTSHDQSQEFDQVDDPLSEAEQQLVRMLEQQEAEALKNLVNAHIKGMPHDGSQKNW